VAFTVFIVKMIVIYYKDFSLSLALQTAKNHLVTRGVDIQFYNSVSTISWINHHWSYSGLALETNRTGRATNFASIVLETIL